MGQRLLRPSGVLRTIATYIAIFGIRGVFYIVYCAFSKRMKPVRVAHHWSRFPLFLRINSSDISVFRQVFMQREYEIVSAIRGDLDVVVDAGANIGLTSIFLANRYGSVSICAVEPDAANFDLLKRNTHLYNQIRCVRAALWNENTAVRIANEEASSWAFRVEQVLPAYGNTAIRGVRLSTLMEELEIKYLSLLKLDIEGAEWEVLHDAPGWINHVESIVVELHDRFRPGCTELFNRTVSGFEIIARSKELTLAQRRPPAHMESGLTSQR